MLSGLWLAYSSFRTAKDLPADAGWLAEMLADPPLYAPWLLLAVCIVFLAWVFWHREDSDSGDGGPAITQETKGDSSHAIVNHGTINMNAAAPAALQPEKPAPPVHHLSGQPGLARFVSKPEPDLPLTGVLVRVYSVLGPVPKDVAGLLKFYQKVDNLIADKVSVMGLHTWGRLQGALMPLSVEAWQLGVFSHKTAFLIAPAPYNDDGVSYYDLHFCKHEIDKIWPEPLRTTNDGRP